MSVNSKMTALADEISVSCSPYIFISVNGQPVSEDVIMCENNGDGMYKFTYNGDQAPSYNSWNFKTQDGSNVDYDIVSKEEFSWTVRFFDEPSLSNIIYVNLVLN